MFAKRLLAIMLRTLPLPLRQRAGERGLLLVALALVALGFAPEALAQATSNLPAFTSTPSAGGGQSYSVSIQTLLFLSALSFLPAVLLLMSGFTRIVIVLSLLRHALGTQTSPPNQVLIGLSLILNFFVMGPALDRVYQDAYLPYTKNEIDFNGALEAAAKPLRGFMLKNTRETDIALFLKLAHAPEIKSKEEIPMRALVPAFVTSELKTAFQIGFMIFIPFLIIDMVVASVLMSMGMMMLSPVLISLPFKLMLFVLVDGWNLLIGSLVASFAV
jgi:flagellar biosynthesis protein FliP